MTKEQRPNQFYPIKNPRTGEVFPPNPNRVWRFFPATMEQIIAQDLIIWPDEAEGNLERPRYKTYFDPESMKAKPCSSWVETANTNDREIREEETEYELAILQSGMNSEGGRVVDRMFGERSFAYPKPLSLLRSLVRAGTRGSDVVLDFFAGSGTTGHAVINRVLPVGLQNLGFVKPDRRASAGSPDSSRASTRLGEMRARWRACTVPSGTRRH